MPIVQSLSKGVKSLSDSRVQYYLGCVACLHYGSMVQSNMENGIQRFRCKGVAKDSRA